MLSAWLGFFKRQRHATIRLTTDRVFMASKKKIWQRERPIKGNPFCRHYYEDVKTHLPSLRYHHGETCCSAEMCNVCVVLFLSLRREATVVSQRSHGSFTILCRLRRGVVDLVVDLLLSFLFVLQNLWISSFTAREVPPIKPFQLPVWVRKL